MDDPTLEPLQLQKKKLSYQILHCSSHSSSYVPENILEDKPGDQSSRWSSDTNNPPQFIVIQLEKPSIVTSLTFGKYEKTHVCNLKKFQVFGGLKEDSMMNLLESGLKNDNNSESFNLKHQLNHHYFPCQFLKIVPIQSWGPSFNFSIWYVGISGDDNQQIVKSAIEWHNKYREEETIKLCLKHFRQHNYLEAFESLEKKTKIHLEHPLLTELHNILVDSGKYEETELLITKALNDGLFSSWMGLQKPRPEWTALILPDEIATEAVAPPIPHSPETGDESAETDKNVSTILFSVQPSNRGGHQMVLDSVTQTIFLFGGWDGNKDLADFWSYHIPTEKWVLLCANAETEGGPQPRSCHKLVLDPVYRQIFVLGRYLERSLRDIPGNIKSDFYVYDIGTSKWTQITDDTSSMGGPSLIFDHQMCLDSEKRAIYVFGGQSLHMGTSEDSRISEKKFSGLFVYYISTGSWKLILEDIPPLMSRTGHSMLFHPGNRKLYIFGGQRKKDDYLLDFFTYNVDDGTVEVLADSSSSDAAIPAVGYTQRATIDWKRNEIYVMTGLNKDKEKDKRAVEAKVSNSFWVYDISEKRWSCIYRNESASSDYWSKQQMIEPRPRYAHQLVYHEENAAHFMFGGNPGGKEGKEGRQRLGDFWRLVLKRPSKLDLERKCRLMIRETQFRELSLNQTPMDALVYLQSQLAECVNHNNKEEERHFQLLAGQIFQSENKETHHQLRYNLFNDLVNFFPEEMTQPPGNLIDLIPFHQKQSSPQPKIV